MTPEGKIKSAIKAVIEGRPHHAWVYMPVPTGYGAKGVPDFIICYRGVFLAVEAKSGPGRQPTKLQLHQMKKIRFAGGIAIVIHSDNLSELVDILDKIDMAADRAAI